jgi:fibronectin-binding autotransporter adhesin
MKPNKQLASYGTRLKQALQIVRSSSTPSRLLLAALVFCAASASAANLVWDAGNTNNGATIDSASGSWDVTHSVTNYNASTSTTATNDAGLVAGGIDWFQVNVPANALAATNILLYATNLPVNVWYSAHNPPSTNNTGDTLLLAGVTSGVSVLTTNTLSSPTNIVQGGTYFIGIDNSPNNLAVGYSLQVNLNLTNAVVSSIPLLNWNNGSGNVAWTQTGTTTPTMGATFVGPDAPVGSPYYVNIDNGEVAATNLLINANGYIFSGSPLYLNPIAASSATPLMVVADGVSVVFSNNMPGNNSLYPFQLGSNGAPSSVTIYGTMTGYQPLITSTNGSTFTLAGGGSDGTAVWNANVRMTGGTWNSSGAFIIGRRVTSPQPNNSVGVVTLDGPTTILNHTSDYLSIGRDSVWNSTLIIQNGATLNDQTLAANNNPGIGIPRPGSAGANNQSWMKVFGGTVNMGSSAVATQPIYLMNGGSQPGQIAALVQTGGVINAWGGIQIGGAAATYNGGSALVTNTGGFLYIGSVGGNAGIRYGVGVPPTNVVSLSGGTVGALQPWISPAALTLATINGNITFQCADASGNANNISLSGALTGPGGFYKSGGGTLFLTGSNNYAGTTVVSNGTLSVSTVNFPSNADVIVDGSYAAAGLPNVSIVVANVGQSWTMTNLSFTAGTPTLSFAFGNLAPSASVASIQDEGNLTFTVVPSIAISGAVIPTGLYPLIHYTGTLSGNPAAPLSSLPAGALSGYVTNITATKTIAFYVNSIVNPPLKWAVGNGSWDTTTFNWTQGGAPALYTDDGTKDVLFDDTASGTSPIFVTLNNNFTDPRSVTANNATKQYIVSGTGSIGGSDAWTVTGAAGLTLSNANTYTGGTTVSSPGLLNINYGGNGGSASAIGTGALNLNTGAKLDNTSGHSVMLNTATPIRINWIDDWTFVGTTNLDLGYGLVTMGNLSVVLTVVSNTLTVNNQITDGGNGYQLIKQGNGTLTLSNQSSSFSGGFQLQAGTLNLNADGSIGDGTFEFAGGILDNTSGSSITLGSNVNPPTQINMSGNMIFRGTTNLNLGTAPINVPSGTLTLSNNIFETDGSLNGHNGLVTVNGGSGTWVVGGAVSDQTISFTVNGGTVDFDKQGGAFAMNGNNLQVNTGGTVVMLASAQLGFTSVIGLGGGTLDLAGDPSEVTQTATFASGTLMNSMAGTACTLTVSNGITLSSSNIVFNAVTPDNSITLNCALTGIGGVITTGAGTVTIVTNSYTGNTTVSNGTLVLDQPTIATASTVTISTNATLHTGGVLNLNFPNGETNTVAALVIAGVSQPAGVYNNGTTPLFITGSGSLLVVPPVTTNPLPGPVQFSVSGSTLALGWPTNLGWILQSQTNSLSTGLLVNSNAWFDIPSTATATNLNITINPANPTVFYRLRHP